MFKKKTSSIDLEAATPKQPVKIAANDLNHSGEAVPFALTQRVEVDKITIARTDKEINVALGTDDGHFINITIKER